MNSGRCAKAWIHMTPAELFDMTGRTALITGGGTGLGRQFSLTLAEAGATVVLAARRRAPLEAVAEAVRRKGGTAHCLLLDVADRQQVDAALTSIAHLGSIDVLVNNAGIAAGSSLLDMEEETWDQVLNVNLKGAWLVARAIAKQMIASGIRGSIINVSSVLGSAVQKGTANYPAAKAALTHLTRSMAVEWARYGIRVNALAPGYFATDLSTAYLQSARGSAMLGRLPQRRLGSPEELSGALLLLASPASNYMTGSVVTVDGGLSLPVI
jgi:NAD(P)-dependent dehydrogenase (short-subunit alcohol dehydrogenase family)